MAHARCQSEIEKMLKDMEGPLSGGRKDLETSIASSGTAPSSSLSLLCSCQVARHVLSGMRGDVEVLMTACQEVTRNQREQTERAASSGGREEGGGG